MYLGDNLLQGGIDDLVAAFRANGARRADPAHAGARPRALRRRRARRRPRRRAGREAAGAAHRPRARRRLHVHRAASTTPRARSSPRRAASSRSPTPSSTSSTAAAASSRTSSRAGGRTPAAWRTCSRPTAWSSTRSPRAGRGRARSTRSATGAWSSRPGARLERSTVRGPAIIGARAHLIDAYVGPYTAIGEDCVIERAEVEHSILLAGSLGAPPRRAHGVLAARPQRPHRAQRRPAAGLPLHGRRQLGDRDPLSWRSGDAPREPDPDSRPTAGSRSVCARCDHASARRLQSRETPAAKRAVPRRQQEPHVRRCAVQPSPVGDCGQEAGGQRRPRRGEARSGARAPSARRRRRRAAHTRRRCARSAARSPSPVTTRPLASSDSAARDDRDDHRLALRRALERELDPRGHRRRAGRARRRRRSPAGPART